ncbi:hypothetical protein AKJ16_DCAP12573 [Drosera capensis]
MANITKVTTLQRGERHAKVQKKQAGKQQFVERAISQTSTKCWTAASLLDQSIPKWQMSRFHWILRESRTSLLVQADKYASQNSRKDEATNGLSGHEPGLLSGRDLGWLSRTNEFGV